MGSAACPEELARPCWARAILAKENRVWRHHPYPEGLERVSAARNFVEGFSGGRVDGGFYQSPFFNTQLLLSLPSLPSLRSLLVRVR